MSNKVNINAYLEMQLGLSDLGIMKSQPLILQLISIFPLRTFHLYVAAFQQHLRMEYISFSRVCGSYHDFLDKKLQLTRKPLTQGFLLVKLKSPPRKFYGRH